MRSSLVAVFLLALIVSNAAAQFAPITMAKNKTGFFVQTSETSGFTGNLGGLAGANGQCYTQLSSQDWKGKSEAGTLTPARISAFLCDSTTCNNLQPNKYYKFARVGWPTIGGAMFMTDSLGRGPGDTSTWDGPNHFGDVYGYWTGPRLFYTTTLWGTTSSGAANSHCADWTASNGGNKGFSGDATLSSDGRWVDGTQVGCNTVYVLICIVNPE